MGTILLISLANAAELRAKTAHEDAEPTRLSATILFECPEEEELIPVDMEDCDGIRVMVEEECQPVAVILD